MGNRPSRRRRAAWLGVAAALVIAACVLLVANSGTPVDAPGDPVATTADDSVRADVETAVPETADPQETSGEKSPKKKAPGKSTAKDPAPDTSSTDTTPAEAAKTKSGTSGSGSSGKKSSSSKASGKKSGSKEKPASAADGDGESPSTTQEQATSSSDPERIHVSLSIVCPSIVDRVADADRGKPFADGTILATTTVSCDRGESVFDVTSTACRDAGIVMRSSYNYAYKTEYVYNIGGLAEKAYGKTSGWTYWVNDRFANTGCSNYRLEDGDVIRWNYVSG